MRTIQYFLNSNNFFLFQENLSDSRKASLFVQIISLKTRIIYLGQDSINSIMVLDSMLILFCVFDSEAKFKLLLKFGYYIFDNFLTHILWLIFHNLLIRLGGPGHVICRYTYLSAI